MPTPCSAADLHTLSRLLGQALRLPAHRTEAWLGGLPATAQNLVPKLRGLLQMHRADACAGFLSNSPRLAEPAPQMSLQPGHRAGPYRLLRPIGRGGMCSVWLAEHTRLCGKPRFAVKLPHRETDADTARRMARERDITALMAHPHVARLRDAGSDTEGRPYLVLDLVGGRPLDQWCQQHQPDIEGRLRLGVQLALAVAHVHSRGVVHRDLKPANVLVDAGGQVHLLDFGIACLWPAQATPAGSAGTELSLTPAYASPEQCRGEPTTFRSDIYSLGIVMFELLTGRLSCPAARPPVLSSRPGHPAVHRPGRNVLAPAIPPMTARAAPKASSMATDAASAARLQCPIDALLRKAMASRPDRRHASALALARALQACLDGMAAWNEPAHPRPAAMPAPSLYQPDARPPRAACPVGACGAV